MSKSFNALGLMSGTSLDGIDAAFLKTDGQTITAYGPNAYRPYTDTEREVLRAATETALTWQFNGPKPDFNEAEAVLTAAHIEVIESLLSDHSDWAETLDLIGFHGQTVLHHPPTQTQKGQTLQLGGGQALTKRFNVPCIYDFRSADVEAGGQGAPLAPIYHKALCEHVQLDGVSAVLNLGGVGNVTLVGVGLLKASDTGPANGPLDQWMQKHGQSYDDGGAVSLRGRVDFTRLERWLARDFFKRSLPRSADRYDFDVMNDMLGLSFEDGAATLAAFCAHAVGLTLSQMNTRPDRLILCGGGRHNQAIRLMLADICGVQIMSAEDVGWESDMIEAQAFAYLAARHMNKLPISFPETTGVSRPLLGGRGLRDLEV
ncbi:MAG: anhydro-N-acetylmuramic acid kinase [Maricaulaceae bacterium]